MIDSNETDIGISTGINKILESALLVFIQLEYWETGR